MAKRIVAMFGKGTFEIIEAEPDRLTEVAGIGPTRTARIVSGWAEQKAVREIMLFLHAHGVGTARSAGRRTHPRAYGTGMVNSKLHIPATREGKAVNMNAQVKLPSMAGSPTGT